MDALHEAIHREPFQYVELRVTCSFGVAWLENEHSSLESLLGVADRALYSAKAKGRNRVEFASAAL